MYIIIIIALIIIILKLKSPQYKGKCGEEIVKKQLESMSGYKYIINNIMINDNGKSRQIDHIAITEHGVFVIETKNYAGTIYGREKSTEWKQYLNQKCFNFKNPIHQNYGHTEIVKKVLEGETDKIYSIVAFTRRCRLKVDAQSTVLYDSQLNNFIKSKEKVLNYIDIDNIYKIIMENGITNQEAIRNHNYNVKHYIEYKNSISNEGKCPRCGRDLIRRKGKRGEFYGCSNYPKCRYTKNI